VIVSKAGPRSLVTTSGIVITFFSCSYLDISVHCVSFLIEIKKLQVYCSRLPHSETHGSPFIYNSPWCIAVNCVLHRLLVPRHPLYALTSFNFMKILKHVYLLFKELFKQDLFLVGLNGLEPPTSRLSGVCSNQLSYRPFGA
jgi:hypothetical protein